MTVCQSTDGAGVKLVLGRDVEEWLVRNGISEQTLGIKSQGAGECISILGRRNSCAKALS